MTLINLSCPTHLQSQQGRFLSKDVGGPTENTLRSAANLSEQQDAEGVVWEGFGGCFNELGWQALRELDAEDRDQIIESLFGQDGLNFDIARLPIGASDYAAAWHSYDEVPGDFALEHFSIERDQQMLIPYIREALKLKPQLNFFASPWSPPTWMKKPAVYNYGRFRMEDRYLDVYARYFAEYIKAYAEEGIQISHIHPQNEPCADQKFPSCLWNGDDLARFIGDHLGPVLERECPDTKIWLGTVNEDKFTEVMLPVFNDPQALARLSGIGLQWHGKNLLCRVRQSAPHLPIWQTENECGYGDNSWDYAHHVFDLVVRYVNGGTSAYTYWNMILPPGGESSWGWKQNSLVTANPETGEWNFNPEFYALKHFAAHIRPGWKNVPLSGPWSSCALAFASPEGALALVTHNPTASAHTLSAQIQGRDISAELPPKSFHTFHWEA